MIAATPTVLPVAPSAAPKAALAHPADLFAAIFAARTVPPASGNDRDTDDHAEPDEGGACPQPLDAILALIAQAMGAAPPAAPAPAESASTVPARAATPAEPIADAAVTPEAKAAPAKAKAVKQAAGESAPPKSDAAVDGDIASLLRRIQGWAETADRAPRAADGKVDAAGSAAPPPSFTAPSSAAPSPPGTAPIDGSAQIIERHLDTARDGEWLDRLARDIAASATQSNRMKFQLNPEHLGSLHIELSHGADGVSIRIAPDSDAGRAMLAGAEPRLAAEARAQGLRVADARIDLNYQGGGQNAPQQRAAPVVRTTMISNQPLAVVERSAAPAERFA